MRIVCVVVGHRWMTALDSWPVMHGTCTRCGADGVGYVGDMGTDWFERRKRP